MVWNTPSYTLWISRGLFRGATSDLHSSEHIAMLLLSRALTVEQIDDVDVD